MTKTLRFRNLPDISNSSLKEIKFTNISRVALYKTIFPEGIDSSDALNATIQTVLISDTKFLRKLKLQILKLTSNSNFDGLTGLYMKKKLNVAIKYRLSKIPRDSSCLVEEAIYLTFSKQNPKPVLHCFKINSFVIFINLEYIHSKSVSKTKTVEDLKIKRTANYKNLASQLPILSLDLGITSAFDMKEFINYTYSKNTLAYIAESPEFIYLESAKGNYDHVRRLEGKTKDIITDVVSYKSSITNNNCLFNMLCLAQICEPCAKKIWTMGEKEQMEHIKKCLKHRYLKTAESLINMGANIFNVNLMGLDCLHIIYDKVVRDFVNFCVDGF